MSRRGDGALQAHGGYVERVMEVTRLQLTSAKPPLYSESSELVTQVIPLPGLGRAEPGRIPSLVLAMVARAIFIQSGLERLRLDVEADGRDSFSAFGVPGDGVGCFTLLRPVVVSVSDLSPVGVLDAVERAMAVQPPAWTWDAALMTGRLEATGPLQAVPLVNPIGKSISLPTQAGLADQVRVPRAVTVWNLPSEEHGLVIDVVETSPTGADSRQEARWEAQVTSRSGYWPWDVDAFLAHFVRSAADFATAFSSAPVPLPKGLDLLGVAEEEIGDLLRELGDRR